jgi:hypothetical protein
MLARGNEPKVNQIQTESNPEYGIFSDPTSSSIGKGMVLFDWTVPRPAKTG